MSTILEVEFDSIPDELKARRQHVLWKIISRGGQPTKTPSDPNSGELAKVNDSATWGTFDDLNKRLNKHIGIGFVFTSTDPFCGIDLDKCRDAETGEIEAWAQEIIDTFDTFTEISPSGTGIHLICQAKKPGDKCRADRDGGRVEIYDRDRFFCMTGHLVSGPSPRVENRQEQLDDLYRKLWPQKSKPLPQRTTAAGNGHIGTPDKISRARAYIAKIPGAISGEGGHDTTFNVACVLTLGFDLKVADALQLLREWNATCAPEWTEGELLHKLESADAKSGPRGYLLGDDVHNGGSAKTHKSPQPMSDMGNGRRLVALHGEGIHYVAPQKRWIVWDGTRWREDDACAVERLAKSVPPRVLREASEAGDDEQQKRLASWAIRSQQAERLAAMVKLARSEPGVPLLPDKLDTDPWLLNCLNGTIDLRTGKIGPHRREHLITKLTPVEYNPKAACPLWNRFLREVFQDNHQLAEFVRRAAGYSLTGLTRERCLFFAWGSGCNGKSTFVSTIQHVAGDYATSITSEMLMIRRGESHPTEICDLAGRRLAVASETEDGRRLAESLVKQLTGGVDRLKGRRMREDYWEFDATFKLWLSGNHKPRIRGTDNAIWDRVKLIPFHVRFDKPDKSLAAKLLNEAPGILRWAVEGCLAWQQGGLAEPEEVTQATAGYRREMDVVGNFVEECCAEGPQEQAKGAELYAAYKKFCDDSGEYPVSRRRFGEAMGERDYRRYSNNGTCYQGIALN